MSTPLQRTIERLVAQGRTEAANLLAWAVSRWEDEVKHRPLVNIHRRSLDDAWRQVIRHCGGDPVATVGPAHDDLLAAEREARAWKPKKPVTLAEADEEAASDSYEIDGQSD